MILAMGDLALKSGAAGRAMTYGQIAVFKAGESYEPPTVGAYVGQIALKDGKGTMSNFKYVDGASVMPPDEEIKKLRPAAAMN